MLRTDQIKQIENYCQQSGVPYYEVQTELVDHMVERIEFRQQTSGASFAESFLAMQTEFNPAFLKQIQAEKKKIIQRAYWRLLALIERKPARIFYLAEIVGSDLPVLAGLAPYFFFWWDESFVVPLLSSIKWVYPLYVLLLVSFVHTQVNFHQQLRNRYRQAFK